MINQCLFQVHLHVSLLDYLPEVGLFSCKHGLINYTDTLAKCRHLKNFLVKGLCGRFLSESL